MKLTLIAEHIVYYPSRIHHMVSNNVTMLPLNKAIIIIIIITTKI
jgi:hypothetical protein